MPRKNRHAPLTSFGPELQQTLRRGASERIEVSWPSEREAIRFHARLNELRAAMRAEAHPDTALLYSCGIRREGARVILSPRDSEFRDTLTKAGVLNGAPAPPLASPPPSSSETPAPLDNFFAELVNKPPEGENNT